MREDALSRVRNPITLLTAILALTAVVVVWLGWHAWGSYQEAKTTTEQRLRIGELRGIIVHLDEVLTMSARMAAATGDLRWEERYREFEPQLDTAIKEAMELAPEAYAGEAAAETDVANIKLVQMENRAFDLVRQGRANEAQAVLFSDEYERQKQIYAQGMTHFAEHQELHLRLGELRGIIIHLDEVLTMSARMAAATGDPQWEPRYRGYEPQLDAAIKEAIGLAHSAQAARAAAKTDAANIRLVTMENRAFDLVSQGRTDEARVVLFSDEYEEQKLVYADGMSKFATALSDAISADLKREQRGALLSISSVLLLIPFLIVGWLVVFRAVGRWETTLTENSRRLTEQAGELAELNRDLDQKVLERTRELEESDAKVRLLLSSTAEAIYGLDLDGNCTFCNPACLQALGYNDEGDVLGKNMHHLIHHTRSDGTPYPVEECRINKAFRQGVETHADDEVLWRAAGGSFPAEYWSYPMRRGSEIVGCVVTFLDITERKAAEEQLKHYAERLRASNLELEHFASVASHDLQEPLRKIQAFGDRLKAKSADALSGDGRDYLERMLDASSRMKALINDLLSYARVTTKAEPFSLVDLAEVTRRVLSDLEARIEQLGARVEVGDLPAIDADPTQMRQLLQNLIGNALKFHRDGVPPVVKIHAAAPEDKARLAGPGARPGGFCRITVEDNGIGFDERYRDRIFDPFQRLHGRGDYGGTGMGLAICRKIAERHGGSITAQSTPGKGSAFIVTLPAEQPMREAA